MGSNLDGSGWSRQLETLLWHRGTSSASIELHPCATPERTGLSTLAESSTPATEQHTVAYADEPAAPNIAASLSISICACGFSACALLLQASELTCGPRELLVLLCSPRPRCAILESEKCQKALALEAQRCGTLRATALTPACSRSRFQRWRTNRRRLAGWLILCIAVIVSAPLMTHVLYMYSTGQRTKEPRHGVSCGPKPMFFAMHLARALGFHPKPAESYGPP